MDTNTVWPVYKLGRCINSFWGDPTNIQLWLFRPDRLGVRNCQVHTRFRVVGAQFQTTSRDPSPENRLVNAGFQFKSVRFNQSHLCWPKQKLWSCSTSRCQYLLHHGIPKTFNLFSTTKSLVCRNSGWSIHAERALPGRSNSPTSVRGSSGSFSR